MTAAAAQQEEAEEPGQGGAARQAGRGAGEAGKHGGRGGRARRRPAWRFRRGFGQPGRPLPRCSFRGRAPSLSSSFSRAGVPFGAGLPSPLAGGQLMTRRPLRPAVLPPGIPGCLVLRDLAARGGGETDLGGLSTSLRRPGAASAWATGRGLPDLLRSRCPRLLCPARVAAEGPGCWPSLLRPEKRGGVGRRNPEAEAALQTVQSRRQSAAACRPFPPPPPRRPVGSLPMGSTRVTK